jgi:hypothetical protein
LREYIHSWRDNNFFVNEHFQQYLLFLYTCVERKKINTKEQIKMSEGLNKYEKLEEIYYYYVQYIY